MIAVDTNILVYAYRRDMDENRNARAALQRLYSDRILWAIPWPCVHEFMATVTSPVFRDTRHSISGALAALKDWLDHPLCTTLGESGRHFSTLSGLCERAQVRGGTVHDARIAAICIDHGVEELWTRDRDFSHFPDLRTRNPLIASLHEPAPPVYRVSPAQGSRLPSSSDRSAL